MTSRDATTRSFLRMNIALGLRPVRRLHWLARYAQAAVEEAQAIESLHTARFGGHHHQDAVHPLLNDDNFPLPAGWRRA